MQGKGGRSVGFLKVSLVLQETKKFGSQGRRRGSEGVSLLAFPSMVKEFAYVLLALRFQVPGGVLCESGEQSSGRLLQFAGQGGAEEWLGLGHILKDSFLHAAPPELGLAGGLGFTVCALGFPYPLEVFEVTPTPFARGL